MKFAKLLRFLNLCAAPRPYSVLRAPTSPLEQIAMTRRSRSGAALLFLPVFLVCAVAHAEPHPIDTHKSVMTIRVFRTGVLSAFGHDHEISAPIAGGTVDVAAKRVELRANAASLRVRDPKASEKDRAEIQKTMLGPDVLDSER